MTTRETKAHWIDEGDEGELEEEEADVLVELGIVAIGTGQIDAVLEEEKVAPLADGPGGGDEGHHHRDHGADEDGARRDPLLVAADQLVLGAEGQLARGQPVDHGQVGPQDDEEDRGRSRRTARP